jgi:hypothetical protein
MHTNEPKTPVSPKDTNESTGGSYTYTFDRAFTSLHLYTLHGILRFASLYFTSLHFTV